MHPYRSRRASPITTPTFLPVLAGGLAVLLAVPSASFAGAGARREPGTSRNPALFLDEPESLMRVSSSSSGYQVEVFGILTGYAKGDLIRAEVKQKGKLLETIECDLHDTSSAGQWAAFSCGGKKVLTSPGAIEAQVVYWDDAAEKEYLVRTFTSTVQPSSFIGNPSWVTTPDDLLGPAYARHIAADEDRGRGLDVELLFWTTGDIFNDVKLRCTVDGKKLADIEASKFSAWASSTAPDTIELVQQSGNDRQAVTWYRQRLRLPTVFHGSREQISKVRGGTIGSAEDTRNLLLIDHPGKWACDVRAKGKTGRRVAFTVTAEGKIARHPSQDAAGAAPTWSNVSMIPASFPDDAPFDERVRPDAMKKSMGFGLPWSKDPSVAELQAGLPTKKKGTIEPRRSKK
jgi:hypothetical protein